VTRTHALDRVLQWGFYVIPQWHIDSDRLIYWNRFSRPDVIPPMGTQLDTWWVDEAKVAALAGRERGRSE
jgi:microcin C transport system substrate-binding protein